MNPISFPQAAPFGVAPVGEIPTETLLSSLNQYGNSMAPSRSLQTLQGLTVPQFNYMAPATKE
jgi:hypothetical protein